MRCTSTKQETNDILGKISFCCHCEEHTCSFNLIPTSQVHTPTFFRYDHLCMRGQVVSLDVILRNKPSYSFGYERLQKMHKIFEGKMF